MRRFENALFEDALDVGRWSPVRQEGTTAWSAGLRGFAAPGGLSAIRAED